jgi:hypothetical protein
VFSLGARTKQSQRKISLVDCQLSPNDKESQKSIRSLFRFSAMLNLTGPRFWFRNSLGDPRTTCPMLKYRVCMFSVPASLTVGHSKLSSRGLLSGGVIAGVGVLKQV